MSADGANSIPPAGTHNKKRFLHMEDSTWARMERIASPLWRRSTKKNPPYGGFIMSAEGIEPSTNGLKGRCSAIELRARDVKRRAF